MSRQLKFLFLMLFAVILLGAGCGSKYVVTTELTREMPYISNLKMGDIVAEFPENYDPSKMPSNEAIERFKHLIMAEIAETGAFKTSLTDADSVQYVITGSILDYSKGSSAARFFIGFGVGAAKVTTTLRLVDARTNEVIFAGNFTGKILDWDKEGSEVFNETAKNFAKALKKRLHG